MKQNHPFLKFLEEHVDSMTKGTMVTLTEDREDCDTSGVNEEMKGALELYYKHKATENEIDQTN